MNDDLELDDEITEVQEADDDDYQDDDFEDWDEWDDDTERPYCDECGTTLVDSLHCHHDRCKVNNDHCTNSNCGNSPHCGDDWY